MKNEHYQLWSFFVKMLENHVPIIENLQFENTALVIKYFLESCAGIIKHQHNLRHYFCNNSHYQIQTPDKIKKENISLKIEHYLGIPARWIYKKINACTHPFYGSTYGIPVHKTHWIQVEVIFWLYKLYLICIPKIFKILKLWINFQF